jgi:hypothetical protein
MSQANLPTKVQINWRAPFRFPDLCCYCGAPAQERLWMGGPVEGRMAVLLFGGRLRVPGHGVTLRIPYCQEHLLKAHKIRKMIRRSNKALC